MTVRPRHLTLRGTVRATGFWLDEAPLPPGEAHRRLLPAWRPGASIYRCLGGWLLRYQEPQSVRVPHALGLPLVPAPGALVGVPLTKAELTALAPPPGAVVLARGGDLCMEVPDDTRLEDPADWLDLSTFRLQPVVPLGPESVPAPLAFPAALPDGRGVFGDRIPPPDRALAQLADALRQRGLLAPSGEKTTTVTGPRHGTSDPGWWRSVGMKIRWVWTRATAASSTTTSPRSGLAVVAQTPLGPGAAWWQALRAAAQTWTARVLFRLRLAPFVGRKQAAYLSELMTMLRTGRVEEALRYAIPINDRTDNEESPPALSAPRPRSALTLSALLPATARYGIALSTNLLDELRHHYESLFERLKGEERYDEAAFVLAELLQETEAAVSFLERRGRPRLAAELAEARQLRPGLVVRQWLVADDLPRALQVARRFGAFAEAVQLLEKDHPNHAQALRLLWADTLATAGDYLGAAEAIRNIPTFRTFFREWLRRARCEGGEVGVRALVLHAATLPDEGAEVRGEAERLLASSEPDASATREALYRALATTNPQLSSRPQGALASLAQLSIRKFLMDTGTGAGPNDPTLLTSLLRVAGDASLSADVPPWSSRPRSTEADAPAPGPWERTIANNDRGTIPVYDIAPLRGGQALLALGELGVRWVNGDGTIVAQFDEPAHHLVTSDHGNRALALAERGEGIYRLARLDLTTRQSEPWCEARLRGWASTFDGSVWFVGTDKAVCAIDALSTDWEALWRFDAEMQDGQQDQSICRSSEALIFLAYPTPDPNEGWALPDIWTLRLPDRTLRHRRRCEQPPTQENTSPIVIDQYVAIDGSWTAGTWTSQENAVEEKEQSRGGHQAILQRQERPAQVITTWTACARNFQMLRPFIMRQPESKQLSHWGHDGTRAILQIWNEQPPTLQGQLHLGATHSARARFAGNILWVCDNLGRVLAVDLTTGRIPTDLRVRV